MRIVPILSLWLGFAVTAIAQNDQTIAIIGEVAVPLTLSRQDLAGFTVRSHKALDHDAKLHEFKGVALFEVLQKAGVPMGSALRGRNLAKYLLVGAADGYEVVYALPEIDPEFTDQVILLATEKDGRPLPAGEGTFRLIAPNDKKQARWVRQVRTLEIQVAKD